MYTTENFQSKKALKEAVANGKPVEVFQPGPFGNIGGNPPMEGWHAVEGPHYPQPHKWYAQVLLKEGHVIKVK